ncbi:hypothetical protein QFZ82_007584 [Streptomyces sp. V4I23]|nr:hypothetical protein [Streptomyces sp. V4I23]
MVGTKPILPHASTRYRQRCPSPPPQARLERNRPYLCAFDADRDAVPVFTEDGAWFGKAASPDAIADLIDAYENGGDQ